MNDLIREADADIVTLDKVHNVVGFNEKVEINHMPKAQAGMPPEI